MSEKSPHNDPDVISESFPALRASQPIGDIFVAAVDHQLIQKMTFFDVRRRLQQDRDVEKYLGIQRPLQDQRVRDLEKYVNFIDATFPTSIIIAIESDYVSYDEKKMLLKISNTKRGDKKPSTAFRNLARVIDGQHRVAGLKEFRGKNFQVLVSIFVGSSIADQAHVFATVNLEQTKVGRSLAIDLFELARTRSPIKTCHNIAVALDNTKGSPFYHRIKRLGVATPGRDDEKITQATFVNALVKYISADPKNDRDLLLRGQKLERVSGPESRKFCFRNLFIEQQDKMIGKILEQYFLAVSKRWPTAWDFNGTGLMLNRTNGFRALMSIFGRVYSDLGGPGDFIKQDRFLALFKRVKVSDDYFTVTRFKPGSSGEADLREMFLEKIFDK